MAVDFILGRLRKIWEIWNIRGVILVGLLLQIILFLGAPMRKRTGNTLAILLVWSSYFLSEWATNFALGQITSGQSSKNGENGDLYAFWASFLLLHHGGPDTITAFEENEPWLRHLLTLISQVVATLYVILRTLPESKLWLPTFLIFFTGIIKYAERTRSLYLASWMLTKPDPGPEYGKLMEAFSSKKESRLPTTMQQTTDHAVIPEPKPVFYAPPPSGQGTELSEFDVVKYAHQHYLTIFKGLVVGLISQHDRQESKSYFRERNAEDALKVLEVELNFIYEILHTKVVVGHSLKGYSFRILTFLSVCVSLVFFILDCKQGLDKFDIRITYTLLLVSLSLETIALFKLIFSDWTAASLAMKSNTNLFVQNIIETYLKSRSSRWSKCKDEFGIGLLKRATPVLLRRWSESMAGFNLITYCLKTFPKQSAAVLLWREVADYLGAKDFLDEWKYASKNPFTKDLWEFIFLELKLKSGEADEPKNIKTISSARGAYVLQEIISSNEGGEVYGKLITDYIENVTFDESLLLWHIATELCYHGSQHKANDYQHHKFISKLVSDYMLYLLVMKPTMMSAVAGIGQIRYRDTCAEAKRFFRNKGLGPNDEEKLACECLLAVNTEVKPAHVKGDRSKSVLFDACMLAKELQKLEEKKKWEVISKVWVEMLSYASNHCRPDAQIEQVSRGGQLINFVWLLMAHLGLADQFVFTANVGPAKLIVDT